MKPIACLLIDDDAEEAEIFHYALEDLNRPIKCVNCRSGKEAIAYLNKHAGNVDYIFLDMNMPGMSGVECLQQLRKLQATCMVPIVLYSSTFIEEQKNMLRQMGASGFLNKTGSVFDLQNALFQLFAGDEINRLTVA